MVENLKFNELYDYLGNAKKMVLSTSFNDDVSSRTISVIILNNTLYFQTDKTSAKFQQLKKNPRASLCFDSLRIQGIVNVIGAPKENAEFCAFYKRFFPTAFNKYTFLQNEVLLEFKPIYAKKWIYEDGVPYEEIFDFTQKSYIKSKYESI